ncbi:unnamed protein product, partial [Meganyctiphanes norvegica]
TGNPCVQSPCLNGGICTYSHDTPLHSSSGFNNSERSHRCICPPTHRGNHCEIKFQPNCYLPPTTGKCPSNTGYLSNLSSQKMFTNISSSASLFNNSNVWYYSAVHGECFPMSHSGCSGSSNAFPSYASCLDSCTRAICCRLQLQHLQGEQHKFRSTPELTSEINVVIVNGTKETLPSNRSSDCYTHNSCVIPFKYKGVVHQSCINTGSNYYWCSTQTDAHRNHLSGFWAYCTNTCTEEKNKTSIYTEDSRSVEKSDSLICSSSKRAECTNSTVVYFDAENTNISFIETPGCYFLGQWYDVESIVPHPCQICKCLQEGFVSCHREEGKRLIRKDFRVVNLIDMQNFQKQIRRLIFKKRDTMNWYNLTNIYRQYLSNIAGSDFYLPWNRYFLSITELLLQEEGDCEVAIPYFDWTVDVGNMQSSLAWEAKYFGSDGEDARTFCVNTHPFQDPNENNIWSPCIMRNFNHSVWLPDAVNIGHALSKKEFTTMSLLLESMSAIFQLYVGGHILTPERMYDPVFLSHIAFIDKIWDEWLTKWIDVENLVP